MPTNGEAIPHAIVPYESVRLGPYLTDVHDMKQQTTDEANDGMVGNEYDVSL
jgi:hypothetical protein